MYRLTQLVEGNQFLIRSETGIRAVCELMRFMFQLHLVLGKEVTFVKCTIVTMARLDAHLATVVTCVSSGVTYGARENRQKLYHKHNGVDFFTAYNELNGCIRMLFKCGVLRSRAADP